jgi:hypothetical protein
MAFYEISNPFPHVKERQKRLREQYSHYHPVVCYPGWLLQNLSHLERAELRKGSSQSIHDTDLLEELRIVKMNGLELRLTPRPAGLFVRWMYHLPRAISPMGVTSHPIGEWAAPMPNSYPVGQQQTLIPWSRLGPSEDATAHEQIEFHAAIAAIPKDRSALPVRYIPADCVSGATVRLPNWDLTLRSPINDGHCLTRTSHYDGASSERILTKGAMDLSQVTHRVLACAAKRITKELGRASLPVRFKTNLQNTMVIIDHIATQAVCSLRRRLRSKTNKDYSS